MASFWPGLLAIGGVDAAVRLGQEGKEQMSPTSNGSFVPAGYTSVMDPAYGYVAGKDNTAALEEAWAEANRSGTGLYFPGGSYRYNGPGLDGPYPVIAGAGRSLTEIVLGDESRLFDTDLKVHSLDFRGMTIRGGLGAIRNSYAGNSVAGLYRVEDIEFRGYSRAAIEHNSVDMPYWKFKDLIFDGANFTTTMGIALSGLSDGCSFQGIEFLRNRVHIKLREGGNNAYISECDFIRFGDPDEVPRIDVWVVPAAGGSNSGSGFHLSACKFGPEHRAPDDKSIVYADEEPGDTNGTRFPVLDRSSSGLISGHVIRGVMTGGNEGAASPLVFSTTPHIRGCVYGDIVFQGTVPDYVLEFLKPPKGDIWNSTNVIGPIVGAMGIQETRGPYPSNGHGVAQVIDPQGLFASQDETVNPYTAGHPAGYVLLLRTPEARYNPTSLEALDRVEDSIGGSDAVLATFPATPWCGFSVDVPMARLRLDSGNSTWIEFDAKSGSIDTLTVYLEEDGGKKLFSRVCSLTSAWRKYRFLWVPRSSLDNVHLCFATAAAQGGDLSVGRVRMYHSQEPLNVDGLVVIGGAVHRLSVMNRAVIATPIEYP